MRRTPLLLVLVLTGCTNAPGAGLLDCTFPSRPKRDRTPERDVRPVVPDVGPRDGPIVPPGPRGDDPPIPPPAGLSGN